MPDWLGIVFIGILMFLLGIQQGLSEGFKQGIEFRSDEIEFVEYVKRISNE